MMFKNLLNNLSKNQKIGIAAILQIVIIAILVSVLQFFLSPRQYASIEDNKTEEEASIPNNAKDFVADNIWTLVSSNLPGVDSNNIDDIVIREGTYQETENEDGSVSVNFIVDIDSLKQTYTISTGWSKDKSVVYEVVVDCPPQSKMKYPETICHGSYNSTYSLGLYLPYVVKSQYEDAAPDIHIEGDEANKTIDVIVSVCDSEKFKKMATDYLESTPIKLSEYTINYSENSTDVICNEG